MNRTCNTITLLAVAGLAFAAGRADIFSDSSAIAEQPQDKGILKDVKEGVKSAGKAITDTANKVVEDEQPAADDAMAAMMKAGTPGEHHKYLDATIGEWDTVVRFAMEPGTPMMESKGTVKREWVLDGHYVREEVDADFMGQAFRGLAYLGYNNLDGQYEIIWMDSHSTPIMFETGTYNPDTKTMSMRSRHRNPATGKMISASATWNMSNPDRHTMTGHAIDENGREFKNFEGVFERKKK